jgi:hypothetical protein
MGRKQTLASDALNSSRIAPALGVMSLEIGYGRITEEAQDQRLDLAALR